MTWDRILGKSLYEKVKVMSKNRGWNVKMFVVIAVREFIENNKEEE